MRGVVSMKKQIMKRAWEIYRTLEGDKVAKLSMAMRMAWAEINTIIEEGKKAYGCAWQFQNVEEHIELSLVSNRKNERRREELEALIQKAMGEMNGMTEAEADDYSYRAARDAKKNGQKNMAVAYSKAYTRMFFPNACHTIGVYVNA
jgi:hypothetical protein